MGRSVAQTLRNLRYNQDKCSCAFICWHTSWVWGGRRGQFYAFSGGSWGRSISIPHGAERCTNVTQLTLNQDKCSCACICWHTSWVWGGAEDNFTPYSGGSPQASSCATSPPFVPMSGAMYVSSRKNLGKTAYPLGYSLARSDAQRNITLRPLLPNTLAACQAWVWAGAGRWGWRSVHISTFAPATANFIITSWACACVWMQKQHSNLIYTLKHAPRHANIHPLPLLQA